MDTAKTQSPAHNRIETYIADRTGTSKLGRRVLTKRQTAEPNRLSFGKAQEAQKAKFSYGKPLSESEPSVSEEDGKRGPGQPIDWLLATAAVLEQDIESSKKELELIRWILEDIDQRWQTNQKPSSRKLRSQKALMAACREYADSMIQAKKQRLMQVNFWVSSRGMRRPVPTAAPEEWLEGDVEWRRWLSEQAAAHSAGGSPIEDRNDAAWRILGPLPHILAAFTWLEG
ncbi:hypothetical protein LQW54_013478 [Pestalotiopsis sp. IQ-011]